MLYRYFYGTFIEEVSMKLNTPYECGMEATASCRDLIGLWVVGSKGECMHPKAGFRLGKNGYRHLAVQASIQIAIVSKLRTCSTDIPKTFILPMSKW